MSNKIINITGSYLQTERHNNVSNKYNVVQPALIGQVMADNGLDIATLSTGKARDADKVNFQRTLSRYRGPEIAEGVNLDVIYDSKHMGRGQDRIFLGIYRIVCTNGLFAGINFFSASVRHNGNTYDQLSCGIKQALSMQSKLTETIKKMQSIQLDTEKSQLLASQAVSLLVPANTLQIKHNLLSIRRAEDQSNDLWTVYNRIQENAMQGRKIAYTLKTVNELTGQESIRCQYTRPIRPNTGKDASFNQALFDAALQLAA